MVNWTGTYIHTEFGHLNEISDYKYIALKGNVVFNQHIFGVLYFECSHANQHLLTQVPSVYKSDLYLMDFMLWVIENFVSWKCKWFKHIHLTCHILLFPGIMLHFI